ncbi:MAG: DUF4150 domain-containing protein [Rhizobacter sp.]
MALTININGLTLCHRGSDGITHNTLPDVCKTPTKGIPLPYENEAYSKDIANGTVTVSADGGNMAAKLGCIFAKSVFDEGGSMGGIISGTFIAEADFITHSFNVFLEGSPACRLTDKMWMNHRNTVNMAGLTQAELAALRKQIQDWICECQKEVSNKKDDDSLKTCTEIGNDRHDCMEQKKKKQNDVDKKKGKKPTHGDEKGYKVKDGKIERTDDITKRRAENTAKSETNLKNARLNERDKFNQARNARTASKNYNKFVKRGGGGAGRGFGGIEAAGDAMGEASAAKSFEQYAKDTQAASEKAAQGVLDAEDALKNANNVPRYGEHTYPDGSIMDEDGKIEELSEYKFVCEKGNPRYRKKDGTLGSPSKGESVGRWGTNQEKNYERLGEAMDNEGKSSGKTKIKKYSASDCPGVGGGGGSDDAKKPDKPSSTGRVRKGKR